MAIPILVDLWEYRKEQKSLSPLWQGGVPAVLIGSLFPLYLWVTKGNMFLFIVAEKYWERQLMFPTHTLWLDLTRFNHLFSAYQIQIVINIPTLFFNPHRIYGSSGSFSLDSSLPYYLNGYH